MEEYRHHVSGFFAGKPAAESALTRLVELGLPRARLHLLHAGAALPGELLPPDSNTMLQHVLVDGAIGTAVGTGIGVVAELALVAANVSLFIASPLIAPLAMLGWGASLGGLVGAAVGTESLAETGRENTPGSFSALVRDAISSGQIVLVAQTQTVQETRMAREVIQAAVGECEDVSAV